MRLLTGIVLIAGTLCAAALLFSAAQALMPGSSPSPAPEGIIPAIVHSSSNAATWLTGMAVEYAGSPLWSTLAGVAIIVLIVSLIMWLRRPRKPLETNVPM